MPPDLPTAIPNLFLFIWKQPERLHATISNWWTATRLASRSFEGLLTSYHQRMMPPDLLQLRQLPTISNWRKRHETCFKNFNFQQSATDDVPLDLLPKNMTTLRQRLMNCHQTRFPLTLLLQLMNCHQACCSEIPSRRTILLHCPMVLCCSQPLLEKWIFQKMKIFRISKKKLSMRNSYLPHMHFSYHKSVKWI